MDEEDDYKYITYTDSKCCIVHSIYKFYTNILANYETASKYYDIQIVEAVKDNDFNIGTIKTIMPKYPTILINYQLKKIPFPDNIISEISRLLFEMKQNKVCHGDFAFRNIGIDSTGKFHLLDLNEIYVSNTTIDNTQEETFLGYLQNDFRINKMQWVF
jgi:hypothetical protein